MVGAGLVAVLLLDGAPAAHAAGAADPPRIAPLLDAEKGRQAQAAYGRFIDRLCDSLWSTPDEKPVRPSEGEQKARLGHETPGTRADEAAAGAKLAKIGLTHGDDAWLCRRAGPRGTALASGSFLEQGADEVVLQVESGGARAEGEQALAVMRDGGSGYRFLRHMLRGNGFEARLRLAAPGARDVLMLCDRSGNMGLYPARCGFFGRGSFRDTSTLKSLPTFANPTGEPPPDPAWKDEVQLVDVRACGPAGSVALGQLEQRDGRLLVELVAEEVVFARGPGDHEGECSARTVKSSARFTVEYAFDGTRFRRATPIPRRVRDILGRWY
jgi:hypothetical protein